MSAKDTRLKKEPNKDIATRLKELREDKELTLNEVAEKLQTHVGINLEGNVGRSAISNIENRKQNLTIELAIAYSKVFDVSLEYIFCLSDHMRPENKGIAEITGLSDKAIKAIKDINDTKRDANIPQHREILNIFCENGFLREMIDEFSMFSLYQTEGECILRFANRTEPLDIIGEFATFNLNRGISSLADEISAKLIQASLYLLERLDEEDTP